MRSACSQTHKSPLRSVWLLPLLLVGCADDDAAGPAGPGASSGGDVEQDVAQAFADNPAYQREAKVMSAPNQVYPYEICVDAADAATGQAFCFQNNMLANVIEGESFLDHGVCEDVRTIGSSGHRPVLPPAPFDPRMDDESYLEEVAWATAQLDSSGCGCCHNSESGYATVFDWGIGPNWVSTMSDMGVVLAAGLAGEGVFVTMPPEDNHGFAQAGNAFVSTDPERLAQFFLDEVEFRGLGQDAVEAADAFYAAVPFAALATEKPWACPEGVGVDAEGQVHWSLTDGRFLNILQGNEENPNIPPLDAPEGTLWRYEATAHADAMTSGAVAYGASDTEGTAQRFPADGSAPAELVEGETYTLFITNRMSGARREHCEFTYPIPSP